jgi:LysM repeat protein
VAEWGALLRRCPGQPDRGFKSLPLRHVVRFLCFSVCKRMKAVVAAIAVVSSVLSFVSSPVSAARCTKYHTAKPNDSWSRLAARFDASLSNLLRLNSATTSKAIFVGDKICISSQPVLSTPKEMYTRRQVVAIIREVWPDELEDNALYVARRESNLVPAVVGGRNDCCLGLFQIYWSVHQSWLRKTGVAEPSQLLDPWVNAQAALTLYRRNGNSWRPWWTSSWRP